MKKLLALGLALAMALCFTTSANATDEQETTHPALAISAVDTEVYFSSDMYKSTYMLASDRVVEVHSTVDAMALVQYDTIVPGLSYAGFVPTDDLIPVWDWRTASKDMKMYTSTKFTRKVTAEVATGTPIAVTEDLGNWYRGVAYIEGAEQDIVYGYFAKSAVTK